MRWRVAKYYPRTEKKVFKNVKNIAHKGRDKMDKYIKRNYESVVSQEVIQLFVTLC